MTDRRPHNSLFEGAPARCMCPDCRAKVLALRCPFVAADGARCGDYRRHRGNHTRLIDSAFL